MNFALSVTVTSKLRTVQNIQRPAEFLQPSETLAFHRAPFQGFAESV